MRAFTILASTSLAFVLMASSAQAQQARTPDGQAMAALDLCAAWMAGAPEATMTPLATQAGFQPGNEQWFWSPDGDPVAARDLVLLVMDPSRGCYIEVQPGSVGREALADALIAWSSAEDRGYVQEAAEPTQAGARVILLRTPATDVVGLFYPEGGETYGHAIAIDFWRGVAAPPLEGPR